MRLCDEAPGELRIDLANLVSADGAGLEVLGLLRSRGAELVGTSPYLALRLESPKPASGGQGSDAGRAGSATVGRTSGAGKTTNDREAE